MIRRYILTGGPGSGKSTLIQALGTKGYVCMEEVSRRLIMEGLEPWADLPSFAEKVLQRMVYDYEATEQIGADGAAAQERVVFFDRGIPDIIAYLKVGGLSVGKHFEDAMQQYRYDKKVFLLPPWRDIYVQEPARWQTFEESERLYEEIRRVYTTEGYQITELPIGSVAERMNFILN